MNFLKSISKKLFSKNNILKSEAPEDSNSEEDNYFITVLQTLIDRSEFIKENEKPKIIDRFGLSQHKVIYGDDILSLEEKKSLGINPRIKAYRSILESVTENSYEVFRNPQTVIEELLSKARSICYLREDRMKGVGKFDKYTLRSSNSEIECQWCSDQNNKKFPLDIIIEDIALMSCKCDSHVSATIIYKFEDVIDSNN